jgi:CHAD domain-containing protein
MPGAERPAAAMPIGEFAGRRIAKVYRRMVRMGSAIDDSSPPEALHELRKKGKELRYLLELFGLQLFDADVVGPLVDSLKQLQELLGRHQDREVQVMMVRSLTGEVALRPGGGAACLAMGTLVARLRDDELAARRAFADSFSELAAADRRAAVNDSLG